MWLVVSIKNLNIFKEDLKKTYPDIDVYFPKILTKNKKKIKNLLGDYFFCYCPKFLKYEKLFYKMNFIKGLKKIIFSDKSCQYEITRFIDYCKSHEDKRGIIKNSFLKNNLGTKGAFLSGPLANYFFDIIQREKNKIKILVGDKKISISDNETLNFLTS